MLGLLSCAPVCGAANGPSKNALLDYHTTAVVFTHWAQLTGDPNWEKAERRIFEFEQKSKANAK